MRTIFRANRFTHSKPLFKEMKVLNIYQINIMQILKFMHCIKLSTNPRVFSDQFRKVDHKYPTRSSQNNFYYKNTTMKSTSFSITCRGPMLWNNFLTDTEKSILHLPLFFRKIKNKLLTSDNETDYFQQIIFFLFLLKFLTIYIHFFG